MFVVGILSAFTDFCTLFQDSILPSGLWYYNMAFYSSLDLHQLNSKTRSKLPVGIHNHCVALGIVCRPRYIHQGSRRKQCTKTVSTISAVGCTIPVVWSSFRRLLTKTRYEDGNVNFTNLCRLEYVSSGALSGITTSSTITQPPVKMALVNARSLSNKTFILNDFFTSHAMDFLFVTEIWLKNGEISSLGELSPSDIPLAVLFTALLDQVDMVVA